MLLTIFFIYGDDLANVHSLFQTLAVVKYIVIYWKYISFNICVYINIVNSSFLLGKIIFSTTKFYCRFQIHKTTLWTTTNCHGKDLYTTYIGYYKGKHSIFYSSFYKTSYYKNTLKLNFSLLSSTSLWLCQTLKF